MIEDFIQTLLHKKDDSSSSHLLFLPPGVSGVQDVKPLLEQHFGTEAHPDLMILDNPQIKVDDIRDTRNFLQSKPFGPLKIMWVFFADGMNTSSANAFLKSLEEPTPRTHIILSTDRPEKILPTIRSRCQVTSFTSDKKMMASEMRNEGVADKDMKALLEQTGGHVGTAIALTQVKDAKAWAKSVHDWINNRARNNKTPKLPTTGKSGLTARQCALVFQAALAKSIREQNNPLVSEHFQTWIERNSDIDRPGLDIKTRIQAWYSLFS